MRTVLQALVVALSLVTDAHAAQPVETAVDEPRIVLGEGVELPRSVYAELTAREDGWAIIERMQQRAADRRSFEGMPHLLLIFISVLLFFWSAMFYYQRKHARLHRTIQLMVEKGLPLPAEILRAAEQFEAGSEAAGKAEKAVPPPWASNLLWGGVLWITIGVTGMAYLLARGSEAWPWALAAIGYGVAACITAYRKRGAR